MYTIINVKSNNVKHKTVTAVAALELFQPNSVQL